MRSNDIKAGIQELAYGLRNKLNRMMDRKWDNYPMGRIVRATRKEYLRLHEIAKLESSSDIEQLEEDTGFIVDLDWLDNLALHTQIVVKPSPLSYLHGRALYSLLRHLIDKNELEHVTVVETGTARGFSTVCMSRAIEDSNVEGIVLTVDVLPHHREQLWNCIDDHDGPKTRAALLSPWQKLTKRCVFLQGDSQLILPRINVDRIHFAFLDAQHIESSVLQEFEAVSSRQRKGDIIVFDDVTAEHFPGVVAAVERIRAFRKYDIQTLDISPDRGIAWATRK